MTKIERKAIAARMVLYERPPLPLGYAPDPAVIGIPVKGGALRVGDVLVHIGRRYRIVRFEPYTGSLLGHLGEGTRTAVCVDAAGPDDAPVALEMPCGPGATLRIRPRPAREAA